MKPSRVRDAEQIQLSIICRNGEKNMAIISELIRSEDGSCLSFGDYTLPEKKKVSDFLFEGN